jgi:hypothetical protein
MDDGVENEQAAEPVQDGEAGISRRTLIRRSAIAGGALLWATPVVQTLGNSSAFANFRGSNDPGGCICTEEIVTIIPISCLADYAGKHRLAPSGKTVELQVITGGSCGTRLHCEPESEVHIWTQVSAVGCELVSQADDTCKVHVFAYPANIVLQVTSTLTCTGGRGHSKSCSDTKVRKICFSNIVGSGSQRCGRYPPHVNKKHGTVRCNAPPEGIDGCGPGFWKNHTDAWADTDYSPTDTVGSVFTVPAALSTFASKTLLEGLKLQGGPGVSGAAEILLRAGVAALLNASNPNVQFGWTTTRVISDVNKALASEDRDRMLALATKLDEMNNRGCPLS